MCVHRLLLSERCEWTGLEITGTVRVGDCLMWMRAASEGDTHGIFSALMDKHTRRQHQLLNTRVPPPSPVDPATTRLDVFRLLQDRGDFTTVARFKRLTDTFKVPTATVLATRAAADELIRSKRMAQQTTKKPRHTTLQYE